MLATTEFINYLLKWGLLLCELWRRVVLYLFTTLRGATSQFDSNTHSHRGSNLTSQLNHYTQQRVLEKLTVPQVRKKFLTFYGIRKFLSMLKNNPPVLPTLSQMNPVHSSPCFCNIHFNITLPSKLRSSKWSLSFVAPQRKPHISHNIKTQGNEQHRE